MFESYRVLDIQKTGERSLVGLKNNRINDESVIVRLFDELDQYLRSGDCDVLVIDVEGIQSLPSSFIGHLVNLRRRVKIELVNTSDYVDLVLETARLSKLFQPAAKTSTDASAEE